MNKLKILLICGHGASDPGACSSFGIERDETRKVVFELVNQFKNYNDVEIAVYPTNRNAYADVVNGCVQVNFANYDYIFEVHFNSATASANGVEVWVTPTEQSTIVEQKIVNKVASLGLTNRGVKREYFAVITNAKNKGASSALIETCFISNQNDMKVYREKFNQICGAMVEGIAEGFGLTKKTNNSNNQNNNSNKNESEEILMQEYIVQYSNDTDKAVAEHIADRLYCPTINCASRPFKYYGHYKTVIAVGEGKNKSGYTNVEIKGKDRAETMEKAIEWLKSIGK